MNYLQWIIFKRNEYFWFIFHVEITLEIICINININFFNPFFVSFCDVQYSFILYPKALDCVGNTRFFSGFFPFFSLKLLRLRKVKCKFNLHRYIDVKNSNELVFVFLCMKLTCSECEKALFGSPPNSNVGEANNFS